MEVGYENYQKNIFSGCNVICFCFLYEWSNKIDRINPSQKKVLVAYFPEYSAKWRDDLELSFESRKWKVNEIDFWEVEKANLRKRNETFLIVVDKMIKEDYKSFLGGTFFSGNISVYDLRTGKKIINYNVHTEESFDVTTRLAKALGELVRK